MIQDATFAPTEDMEMVIDIGKVAEELVDIDIDLDDMDQAQQQDEMMVENSNEISYDLELGDAAAVEQDAEMTDESVEDFLFDEDISDAPADQVVGRQAVGNADVSHPDANEKPNDNSISTNSFGTQQTVEIITRAVEPSLIGEQRSTNIQAAVLPASHEEVAPSHQVGQEEIEELITWESDAEEEVEAKDTNKVGEAVTSVLPDKSEVTKPSEIIEPPTVPSKLGDLSTQDDAAVVSEPTTDTKHSNGHEATRNPEQKQQQIEIEEFITYDDDDDDGDEVKGNQGYADIAPTNHDLATHLDGDDGAGEIQVYHVDKQEQGRALEILHPIVIRYMGEEMSLFPPTVEEAHTIYFLGEKKLAFDTCNNLFTAFRKVLGDNISKYESLVLGCPDMGLKIREGIPEASTLSVAQLLHIHLGLSHNDGIERSAPLLVVLEHEYDVSARLNELYGMMEKGEGLPALTSQQWPEPIGPVGLDHDAGDLNESVGAVQDPDQYVQTDYSEAEITMIGHTTPKHESAFALVDEEPDFSSPGAARKSSKLIDEAQPGVDLPEAQVEQALIQQTQPEQKIVDEITYEDDDDEITYSDDDEDEQVSGIADSNHPEKSMATISAQSPAITNTQASKSSVFARVTRLIIIDHETLKHHTTNHSEDYLGLDDGATGPDPLADNPTTNEHNGEAQTIIAVTSTKPAPLLDTGMGTNHIASQASTPGNTRSSTVSATADDDDDIGYSDEEDDQPGNVSASAAPITTLADPTPFRSPSPKRSLDEVDDSGSKCCCYECDLQKLIRLQEIQKSLESAEFSLTCNVGSLNFEHHSSIYWSPVFIFFSSLDHWIRNWHPFATANLDYY